MNDYQVAFFPPCRDSRECFGAREYRGKKKCSVLSDTYLKDGACSFCKKVAIVTDGKEYPVSPYYKTNGGKA